MNAPRPIEIVGGGVAGLSLGCALRKQGVPTTILEAGNYPRHRVCGEFIAGLDNATIEELGVGALLADAPRLNGVRWFQHGRKLRDQRLGHPAISISRHELDDRLAKAFVAHGGTLRTQKRIDLSNTTDGRVFATGRRRHPSPWLGLKLHALNFELENELEFHLGQSSYVGLAPVEAGRVNVCGLFRRRDDLSVTRGSALIEYLRATGYPSLAQRLAAAEVDENSFSAVAGFDFGRSLPATATVDRVLLGDAYGVIPPYTGHGMAMAFQSAAIALPHLLRYSQGALCWADTVRMIGQSLHARLSGKLALASRLHPFFVSTMPQNLFGLVNRSRLVPLGALVDSLHR